MTTISTSSFPRLAAPPQESERVASDLPQEEAAEMHPRSKNASIVTIVETVQKLKDAYRPPTQQELELLKSWSGWGAYAPAFEIAPKEEKQQRLQVQLRMLLGEKGYEEASGATPTSYFTSPHLSKALWHLAENLGFTGGLVLEPGCGSGQVLSCAPASLDIQMTGVEKEPFSASIAQLLFPEAHIINAPLQDVALPEETFDLVIGNVPFADVAIFDRALPFKQRFSLHNYCIYRGLQALRPGGLAIVISSRYTMDAEKSWVRTEMAKLAHLLGAIRLPSYGHSWAKTAVVTDILVLQRRFPGQPTGQDWMTLAPLAIGEEETVSINTYYIQNQGQILGTPALARGMYRNNELVIKAPENLEAALQEAADRIIQQAQERGSLYVKRLDPCALEKQLGHIRGEGLHEGCFYLLPQGLVEIRDGQPKPVTSLVAEMTALVRLRDSALALMEAERDYSISDEELAPLRTLLNARYEAYVKAYGPLRRSTLIRKVDKETGEEHISRRLPSVMYTFRQDEHYPLVLSLESYSDEDQKATKAAIFFGRVNRPAIYKETADSPEEAIALSLDRYGKLDLAFITQATGQQDVPAYLGDLVYEDPEEGGRYEIAPLYLSGNVRQKLKIAQHALESDPARWQRNVDALAKVQPDPLPPEEIRVLLGAPWVPGEDVVQFCQDLIGLQPIIKRDTVTGIWDVSAPAGVAYSSKATSTWGTKRVSFFKLVEHLLNHKTTSVEDEDAEGKRHPNTEETMLAQQKKREIQMRFGEWIWEDQKRTQRLCEMYNTLYNGVVSTHYDGSHLSFPGMDPYWAKNLYSWQRDFIARMITSRSALCAFPVGAGKTKIQIAGAMTLRRMGLISKAAVIVPNHLLEQITSEAKQLYPAANILMISREDLAQEKRRLFLARIATGDHDLIITTHSAFEAIGVHPTTKSAYIRQKMHEYRQVLYAIDQRKEDKADKRRIKRIEKALQRLQENLNQLLAIKRDPGITFEQLGISYLVVDEFHFFKNLGLPTNQDKLTVAPSQRAQDMLMKMSWLEKKNRKRPFASTFTATPMSNSMVEALVMLWYLNRDLLREYEIAGVDDFASLYIESEEKIEVTPNGAGFRLYERPSKFVNIPEFMHLFQTVVDIRSPDILAEKRPDLLEHTVSVDPTPEVIEYVNSLVIRSEKLRKGQPAIIKGKEDNMLWVTGDGRKAALWLGLHGMPEAYPAKLDAIASEAAKVYHRWQEKAAYLPGKQKSLQILFCDQGTPNKERGDQVYGQIKRLLIQKGIPERGIRYIHEAETDAAKAVLFEQCRAGEVAILLGSTAKLGTGTNIQTRCAAIHHCDAPWRPDEVEQRTGRGQRPGNLYPVVEVFYYVQKRTFDAYSWQILANKARPYNQIRSSSITSREMDYSDDSTLTYGQVKAAATGDILLLEHANVTLSADAFERLANSFKRARERDRQETRSLRSEAQIVEGLLLRHQTLADQVALYPKDAPSPFTTADRVPLEKKEAWREHIVRHILEALKGGASQRKVGHWCGVPIFIRLNYLSMTSRFSLVVADPYSGFELEWYATWLDEDNHWRFGWRIEQFFGELPGKVAFYKERKAGYLAQAASYEEAARATFPHHDAWQATQARKKLLDDYIEKAAQAGSEENLREVAELRQHLLATAPSGLLDRPQPKNTAKYVLPPRDPGQQSHVASPLVEEQQRIEIVERPETEQSIEDVVRDIKQSLVGTRATVSFGDIEALKKAKKEVSKKKASKSKKDTKAKTEESFGDLWSFVESEATIPPQQISLW